MSSPPSLGPKKSLMARHSHAQVGAEIAKSAARRTSHSKNAIKALRNPNITTVMPKSVQVFLLNTVARHELAQRAWDANFLCTVEGEESPDVKIVEFEE